MTYLRMFRFQYLVMPLLRKKPKYDKKYAISICTIFKDEAPYIKEWIEFHSMMGVDHFYLYNNGSTDNYLEILQPYIDEGLVTLVDFPGEKMQLKAYCHFYEQFASVTQWVSFLDIDEFICPNTALNIKQWIKSYERFPIILVYWKMFGTSGLMQHDFNKLVIEQYHICWDSLYHVGKCFINTDYPIANKTSSFHHEPVVMYPLFGLKLKVTAVNQFKKAALSELGLHRKSKEKTPPIQVNHYWSKAWELYDAKRNRPSACRGELKTRMPYFFWHENHNCTTDYNIYKYVMQLKLRMKGVE